MVTPPRFVFQSVALVLAAILSVGSVQAQIHVDKTASGANDGTSWADAYTDLQDALNAAKSTDEIWIAEGTYLPVRVSGSPTIAEREIRFDISGGQDGLGIYGGFEGVSSETSLSDRDPNVHPVILSGDIDQNDVPFAPATDSDSDGSTRPQTDHIRGGNSFHVLYLDGTAGGTITSTTVLDGVTVTGGLASGGKPNDRGAGLYCDGSNFGSSGVACNPTIRNVTFSGNEAHRNGGALYNHGEESGESQPVLIQTTFDGNYAREDGGAIFGDGLDGSASPTIEQATFSRNAADKEGGAIFFSFGRGPGVQPTIDKSVFSNNVSGQDGGAMFNATTSGNAPILTDVRFEGNAAGDDGGGMYNHGPCGSGTDCESSPELTNVVFLSNSATYKGGAIYNYGWGSVSSPTITDAVFDGNTADEGGAIFNNGGDEGMSAPTLTNVTFIRNAASTTGGAIHNDVTDGGNCAPVIVNAVFSKNTADDGGAMFTFTSDDVSLSPSEGSCTPEVINATFTENKAATSGGAIHTTAAEGGEITLHLANSILWNNRSDTNSSGTGSGDQTHNDAGSSGTVTFTIGHTLLEGGLANISNVNGASTTDDGGNLSSTPQFVNIGDPDGADDAVATSDDGLRLRGSSYSTPSPAIDAGDDAALPSGIITDLLGTPRMTEGDGDGTSTVDLGAYEYNGTPLPVEFAAFDAQVTEDAVAIRWTTASETNNAGFRVQRLVSLEMKDGGTTWQTIGSVDGDGTTTDAQSYRFEDADLPYAADRVMYRLKQVDTDGTASFSDEVIVERNAVKTPQLLETFPNPARSTATVRYAIPEGAASEDVRLRLYDVLGRQVHTVIVDADAGRHERQLPTDGLSSGVYFLRLQVGTTVKTKQLTVVR